MALSSVQEPSNFILDILKKHNVNSIVKMASSYKFCAIGAGDYDIYAARERANEWDYLCWACCSNKCRCYNYNIRGKEILYGKEDYKNPSILIKRSNNLND